MYRDILTNKWVLSGIAFLIVFAVACVLWYQHDTADERKAAAAAEKLLRQSELSEKSDTGSGAEQVADVTSENLITDTRTEGEIYTEAHQQTENGTAPEKAKTSDERMSLFGLGPYPEVPDDYPHQPFKWEFWGETLSGELMSRVRIKLWKQGIKADGATFENGKVYPNILGTVYVEWDGDYIRRIMGHPDDDFDVIEEALEAEEPPPPGITVLSFSEGIDPYTFLEFNQKE